MKRIRRRLLLGGLAALATPSQPYAQPRNGVRRIAALAIRPRSTPENPDVFHDSLMQGLRELGYIEGKTVAVEWRFADGDYQRVPALLGELVRTNPEVIVTHSTQAAKAAQAATRSIPLIVSLNDPVGSGLVSNLARPGGNITGTSVIANDVSAKQVELLRAMIPSLSQVAFLAHPGNPSHRAALENVRRAGRIAGVEVLPIEAGTPEAIDSAFAKIAHERIRGVIVASDAYFMGRRQQIGALAAKNRVASMFVFREHVVAGGLVSYGQDLAYIYRYLATYVDRVLKGAKPGDLPIEESTKIHFAINAKTAKAIGVRIPQQVLLRADEVIE